MTRDEISAILADHAIWLHGWSGKRANLRGANLSDAFLRGANLSDANLSDANLSDANLSDANLRGANLRGANLSDAFLRGANLSDANLSDAFLRGAFLRGANLSDANLSDANLRGANLSDANLRDANLSGAFLPHFQLPGGDLIGWGKKGGSIVKMLIAAGTKRTACLINRKCRAEAAFVLEIEGADSVTSERGGKYVKGQDIRPDRYCDDIRVDCSNGIHFFQTRAEAEKWQ